MKAWSERQAARLKAAAEAIGMAAADGNGESESVSVVPTLGSSRSGQGGRSGIVCSYWKAGRTCKYGKNCWNLHVDPISGIGEETEGDRDPVPPAVPSRRHDGFRAPPPLKRDDGFAAPMPRQKGADGFAAPPPLMKAPAPGADGFAAPPPLMKPPAPRPGFTESRPARPSFREA
eukprot:CAMPEP_0174386532 /NCGR_PEP_ID=MMETSP0811_2-20130205/127340_1 /TAXON_ID=73025 ORGANISM="Eutreptiella gymnastica-like, Strain CCMP1594" /NCGR_SAMPLE_ID=MMETSP0811_2 /ASSEMBLY_ACC=CAM_ASM_000667 /LENGTH=174 /DNA_ID=CAMNT_0015541237 /DNA_START=45 /DNA_END=569 /DNA_ORIENTATION=+